MPSTNKDKREEISSPSSLIPHYGSLVQRLPLRKKKKRRGEEKRKGNQTPQAVAVPQKIIQFLMKRRQTAVLVDSFHNGQIY